MKKYIARILILFVGMIVLTACPSEFVNPLEKNVNVTLSGILGDWKMGNIHINIRQSLLEGNYFVDYNGDVTNEESQKYTFLMHVTKINNKYYAVLRNKKYEKEKFVIAEFRNWVAFLSVKVLYGDSEMMNYTSDELYNYIKKNQNKLKFQEGYTYDFERVKND